MTGRVRRVALGVAAVGFSLAVLAAMVSTGSLGWSVEGGERVETVLDIPYGSQQGEVGVKLADEYGPGSPPACPEAFQVTQDGVVWVLDTVNSRVLSFRNGKQESGISTVGVADRPMAFGIVRDALFVVKRPSRLEPVGAKLMRYDFADRRWSGVSLRTADGRTLSPEFIRPIGNDDSALLVSGTVRPGEEEGTSGAVVLDQDGNILTEVAPSNGVPPTYVPGADGAVRRVPRIKQQQPTQVPVTVESWGNDTKSWTETLAMSLPLSPELSTIEGALSVFRPCGVDSSGRLVATLSEGRPLFPRFVQIAPTGEVLHFLSPAALGLDPSPLSMNFPAQHYQMAPDGSLLAQYATKDRYKVIKVCFD